MANCTNVTTFWHKASGGSWEELVAIKDYPDLGGDKEKLDSTTLKDTKKKSINGLEDTADLSFTANYEKEDYDKLIAIEDTDTLDDYAIKFGEDGIEGIFAWQGKIHVYPTSGSVNAVREMKFSTTVENDEGIHEVDSLAA